MCTSTAYMLILRCPDLRCASEWWETPRDSDRRREDTSPRPGAGLMWDEMTRFHGVHSVWLSDVHNNRARQQEAEEEANSYCSRAQLAHQEWQDAYNKTMYSIMWVSNQDRTQKALSLVHNNRPSLIRSLTWKRKLCHGSDSDHHYLSSWERRLLEQMPLYVVNTEHTDMRIS